MEYLEYILGGLEVIIGHCTLILVVLFGINGQSACMQKSKLHLIRPFPSHYYYYSHHFDP